MAKSILVPARKFARLLDYMQQVGLDPALVAAQAGLSVADVQEMAPDERLPGSDYSKMYRKAVQQWQSLKQPIPWGAGIGSEAFELMCHSIIASKTLGQALSRAQRFDKLVYPMINYRMQWSQLESEFSLSFHVRIPEEGSVFAPNDWDRAQHFRTVAMASGLLVWHGLCGWLIGRSVELSEVFIAGDYVSDEYQAGLGRVFECPVHFEAEHTRFVAPADFTERRLVQTGDSLEEFLESSVHELISSNQKPASTSAAIRSLIKLDFSNGIPSFESMAGALHMSESSLRRRLLKEETSYQAIKDQVRCEIAIEHLRRRTTKINDLSELLGFTEPSSFVRSFRGWMGVTPRAYRDSQA